MNSKTALTPYQIRN